MSVVLKKRVNGPKQIKEMVMTLRNIIEGNILSCCLISAACGNEWSLSS